MSREVYNVIIDGSVKSKGILGIKRELHGIAIKKVVFIEEICDIFTLVDPKLERRCSNCMPRNFWMGPKSLMPKC
jgi:hypothetical protein